jgi:hypothetical protein
MLLPMLLPSGHLVAMAAAAFLVFSERLVRPMAPAWEWRGLSGVKRLLTAQAGFFGPYLRNGRLERP